MSEADRREHVRQRVSRVQVRVASRESLKASYLRDLSLGGLFVRSKSLLPRDTPVVVELSVAEQPPTRLRGTVVRHEHAPDGSCRGFGVRFSFVDAETLSALELILREHQRPSLVVPTPTELAELRGTMEAYEESLALLRESETTLAQKLEQTEVERGLLAEVARELQARVALLESERTSLKEGVDSLSLQAVRREGEAKAFQATITRLLAELGNARASEAELKRLATELAVQKLGRRPAAGSVRSRSAGADRPAAVARRQGAPSRAGRAVSATR